MTAIVARAAIASSMCTGLDARRVWVTNAPAIKRAIAMIATAGHRGTDASDDCRGVGAGACTGAKTGVGATASALREPGEAAATGRGGANAAPAGARAAESSTLATTASRR
ncbi:MAG: hypothetical protein ABI745_09815 [Caldimonas sp.]